MTILVVVLQNENIFLLSFLRACVAIKSDLI